jgi:nucleoid-associated protein YgaU
MTDKDVVFENRKSSLFASGASAASGSANEIVSITEESTAGAAGASIEDAMATAATEPETIELSELKDSIEKVDGWSSQKLGLE